MSAVDAATSADGGALAFAGPGELAKLVRERQVKPRELVELFLGRIEALDPRLNAFRTTMSDEALAAADALSSTELPLAGVPIAVKDDIAVAGQSSTMGLRRYWPPEPHDAEAVRRLRAAGAIPIGITNVPELMIWPWTISEANGVTRNPWDPSRTPGGSSGGSAAAVASGMVPAATGSDGGGSIRIPSACCGLVGMKPTRGRVPGAGWVDLSTFGALARSVADSALMLSVMSAEPALADVTESPRLKVAVSRKVPPGLTARLHDDQREALQRTAGALQGLGHTVMEADPPYRLATLLFTELWTRAVYEDSLGVPDRSLLEPLTRQLSALGRRLVPDRRRGRLVMKRAAVTARILSLWDQVDVLLMPCLSRTALPAEGGFGQPLPLAFHTAGSFMPWTPLANLTGQPAISLPAGIGDDGLPLSVQLMGRPGAEQTLYGLAAQLEEAQPWRQRRPPVS